LTAGLWPWKQESAKECVIAHQPRDKALKIHGAQASDQNLYQTDEIKKYSFHQVERREGEKKTQKFLKI